MNGIDPWEFHLSIRRFSSTVGDWSFGYSPLALATLPSSSTEARVRSWLVYFAPATVQVGMPAGSSVMEDLIVVSPRNVPKRLSETIRDHRSVAQNGQYSAREKTTTALPFFRSGRPEIAVTDPVAVTGPAPTVLSACAGTVVTS